MNENVVSYEIINKHVEIKIVSVFFAFFIARKNKVFPESEEKFLDGVRMKLVKVK